jgi:predicted metal-dependent hydrolase
MNPMSRKSEGIAKLISELQGKSQSAYYLGFFECFNQELYFEAHDVLEELWLKDKSSSDYSFYKGLIQLAGAFVHLQKNRLRPASALFRLTRDNLRKYPDEHADLDVKGVLDLVERWLTLLEKGELKVNPFQPGQGPRLYLQTS